METFCVETWRSEGGSTSLVNTELCQNKWLRVFEASDSHKFEEL